MFPTIKYKHIILPNKIELSNNEYMLHGTGGVGGTTAICIVTVVDCLSL